MAVSTIAAAIAAVSSCQQTQVTSSDRTVPYKVAMFEKRTEQFSEFMAASQELNAAFRKALFVNSAYLETPDDVRKQTDAQLEQANADVAFVIDEYTEWLNVAQASNVGWREDTTQAINETLEAGQLAMGCYFAFGPSARQNMPPEYWERVRQAAAQDCPQTRLAVVAFNQASAKAYDLMQRDIRAVTLPDL